MSASFRRCPRAGISVIEGVPSSGAGRGGQEDAFGWSPVGVEPFGRGDRASDTGRIADPGRPPLVRAGTERILGLSEKLDRAAVEAADGR